MVWRILSLWIRMSLSSSSQYDQSKWEVKRLLTANHTEAVSLARGFVAGIIGIFGGPNDALNKKMDDVVDQLKHKIEQQMSPGECVVGLQIQFAEFGRTEQNTFLSGSAIGTLLGPKLSVAPSPAFAPIGQGGRRTRKLRRRSP